METKHTPEPWQIAVEHNRLNSIRPENESISIAWTNISNRSYEVGAANARRIVAAINFLRNIPTDVLERAVSNEEYLPEDFESVADNLEGIEAERNQYLAWFELHGISVFEVLDDLKAAAQDDLAEAEDDMLNTPDHPDMGAGDDHAEAVREFVEDHMRVEWDEVDEELLKRVPLEEIQNVNNTYKHGTDYTVICIMAETQYEQWVEEYSTEGEE